MIRLKVHYEQLSTDDGLVQKQSQHTAKIRSLLLHINLGALHNSYFVRSLEELLITGVTIWDIMHGKK